jgi:hypothetical protein
MLDKQFSLTETTGETKYKADIASEVYSSSDACIHNQGKKCLMQGWFDQ